jgi:hypothetical protein
MEHRPPAYQEKTFSCPQCGVVASQEWRELHYWQGNRGWNGDAVSCALMDKWEDQDPFGDPETPVPVWFASLCAGCELHSLWIGDKLAYPDTASHAAVPSPNPDMPPQVIDLYREAAAVLPHSRRAAVALCRAALEGLAKALTPELDEKIRLDNRLASLSHDLENPTSRALQIIRHAGNTALHGANDSDESAVIYLGDEAENDIAELFFVAINELASERISRPRRINEAYAKLPPGVREEIDRKLKAQRAEP